MVVTGYLRSGSIIGEQSFTYQGIRNAFIVKLSSIGEVLWVSKPLNSRDSLGIDVKALESGESIYSGRFRLGEIAFTGQTFSPAGGNESAFVAKVGINGEHVWAAVMEAQGDPNGNQIVVNIGGIESTLEGFTYVAGSFFGAVKFGDNIIGSNSSFDETIFIAKLDQNGEYIWVKTSSIAEEFSANSSTFSLRSIALTDSGGIAIAGMFRGQGIQFGQTTLSTSATSGFVAELDADGNFLWADSYAEQINSISYMEDKSVLIGGKYADNRGGSVEKLFPPDLGQGSVGLITATGELQEGVTLLAPRVEFDPNGDFPTWDQLGANPEYQWLINGTLLPGATSSSYMVPVDAVSQNLLSVDYSVKVTYTDAHGYRNTSLPAISSSLSVVKLDNGLGTLQQISALPGETFNEQVTLVSGSVIGDAEGVSGINSYQWSKDGTIIVGANSSRYVVDALGEGSYSVTVNYSDLQGNQATLNSAVQSVSRIDNGAGLVSNIGLVLGELFNVGATLVSGEISGDLEGVRSIDSRQWFKDGVALTGEIGNTLDTTVYGVGRYKVDILYTDQQNYQQTISSASQLVIGDLGPGQIGSITNAGALEEGTTLFAPAISDDPNGISLTPNYSYQWFLDGVAIAGSTAATQNVGVGQSGIYSVEVEYSDLDGFRSSLVSVPTFVAPEFYPVFVVQGSNEADFFTSTYRLSVENPSFYEFDLIGFGGDDNLPLSLFGRPGAVDFASGGDDNDTFAVSFLDLQGQLATAIVIGDYGVDLIDFPDRQAIPDWSSLDVQLTDGYLSFLVSTGPDVGLVDVNLSTEIVSFNTLAGETNYF